MRFLRTNTACRITVGPFFDKTDGVTPETALTVTSCKLTFMVDNSNVPTLVIDAAPTASGGNNDMVHVTGDDAGFYDLELTAANTNYLGRAMLAITDAATHCPIFHEFMILPAVVYDAMVLGTDNLQVDTVQVTGTAQTGRDLGASVLLSSGTGTGQISLASGLVTLAGVTHTGAVIPTVTTTTNLTNAATNGDLTATMKTSVTTAATAATPTVTLANGAHGGASATMVLKSINVSNATGDAVSISATGSDGHGVYVAGNGGGDGMHVVGGATGHGLHLQGGSTSGDGLHTVAQTAGDGIQATGAGGGLDINGTLSAVTLATTTTTLTNLPAITTDWLTGTGVAASAVTKIQAGLSTYAGTDTSGTTTLLARLTGTRAGYLDNLSGGAVMLASSYSAPPSAATISTQVASDLATAHGAGSWATATGFSTHSAADVWAVATRVLTAGTNIALAKGVGVTGFTDLSAAQVNAEVDTALADYDAPTNTEMIAAFTQIKGATWETTDTLEAIRDRGDAAWITATGFATAASLTTVEGKIDTIDGIVDSILVDTAEIGAAGAGLTALASAANLATANTALAKLDDTVEDNAGTFRFTTASLVNAPSGSGLDAAATRAALGMSAANMDSQLSAIVTDTNELQTDWVNGGRLDLILDARSSQTSVDDLPTIAELAIALGTAGDAVLAAIAALNDITTGEVRTELATELARIDVAISTRATPAQVATELGTYDAPTNAEMVAAFTEVKGTTWATTDTLEAIRDRGDAAWLTATGFSTHSAADVRTELAVELARIDAAVSTRATPAQVATELATYDGPTNAEMVAAIDALPTAAENAAALMDLADGIETSITLRQAVRLILAASAGELSGAATTTITIRNVGDTKNRITATVDADGNRTAVSVDGT